MWSRSTVHVERKSTWLLPPTSSAGHGCTRQRRVRSRNRRHNSRFSGRSSSGCRGLITSVLAPVALHLPNARKLTPTVGALDRADAAVHAQVLVQVAALRKGLVTSRHRAPERPITRVHTLVNRKTPDNVKGLVAPWKIALVRPLVRMRPHVLSKRVRLAESFLALGAHIRPVARVCLDVSQELLFLRKGTPLGGARTADPAALVFIFARANVLVRDMLRKLAVRVKARRAVDPATRMTALALFHRTQAVNVLFKQRTCRWSVRHKRVRHSVHRGCTRHEAAWYVVMQLHRLMLHRCVWHNVLRGWKQSLGKSLHRVTPRHHRRRFRRFGNIAQMGTMHMRRKFGHGSSDKATVGPLALVRTLGARGMWPRGASRSGCAAQRRGR